MLSNLALALTLILPATPGTAPAADLTPASIDAFVERYRAATGLPGAAVAVARGTRVVHAAGYGTIATGAPVTADTPMAIASLSKSVTSLAVMRLVERGKVELDRPVRRYLPEFRMADPRAARITVRQLLDQTSGMADTSFREKSLPQPQTLAGAVARLRTARLATEPGTAFSYHNTNYQVAARLVEVVSGRRFADQLQATVFGPLGMGHSRTIDTAGDLPGSARGHVYVLGRAVALPEPAAFGNGSGGVLSTASDMARWLVAQHEGVLTPENTRETRTGSKPNPGYGLGWEFGTTEGRARTVGHDGDLFTSTAAQLLLPESGYGIAVMANTGMAFADADALRDGLVDMIEGRFPRVPSGASFLATDALFLAVTVGVVALAVRGVARARRWAGRRTGRRLWPLLPYLVPPALCLSAAPIHRVLANGRDAMWIQLAYIYPTFMLALTTAAVACAVVVTARLSAAVRRGGAR